MSTLVVSKTDAPECVQKLQRTNDHCVFVRPHSVLLWIKQKAQLGSTAANSARRHLHETSSNEMFRRLCRR